MIGDAKVLALITARGGSKGLPRKNVLPLGDKPLIAWSIEAARQSRTVDRLILSSDDPEIIDTARTWGCEVPFVRPAALATDTATSLDVVRDALSREGAGFDYVVLLQPTSPMRTALDIDGAVELCHGAGASTCVGVTEAEKSPFWMMRLGPGQRLEPLFPREVMPTNRQSAPKVYQLNGAIYVARIAALKAGGGFVADDTVAWVMPADRSIDIDTHEDLELLQLRLRR